MQQPATGRHRMPRFWPQNPPNLLKSVFPPGQECQIAHLSTLASPVEPQWHQGLAADTKDLQNETQKPLPQPEPANLQLQSLIQGIKHVRLVLALAAPEQPTVGQSVQLHQQSEKTDSKIDE